MSELTKKLHVLKDGAAEEELVTLYSTADECAEPNLKFEVDGATAYAKLGDVTDTNASSLRIYRNSDAATYAVLKTDASNYWIDIDGVKHIVDASEVETISNTAFMKNESVYKVVFPSCKKIEHGSMTDGAFYGCKNLVEVSLHNVDFIGIGAFMKCTSLVKADISNATYICGEVFWECKNLTDVSLANVEHIYISAFYGCTALRAVYLPQCTYLLVCFDYCTSLTEIHFAAANQATIEALDGYSYKFGATDATIYFDL